MMDIVSACGVLCSECPAFKAATKGIAHQKRTAAAWKRIYRSRVGSEKISCGGCTGPADQLFHSSIRCKARQCCLANGFSTCAECPQQSCSKLEKAQAVWDGVPKLVKILSPEDFTKYAQPYCGHRARLNDMRCALGHRPRAR